MSRRAAVPFGSAMGIRPTAAVLSEDGSLLMGRPAEFCILVPGPLRFVSGRRFRLMPY